MESIVGQTLEGINAGVRIDDLPPTVTPPSELADRPCLRPKYDEPELVVCTIWRQYAGRYDGKPAHLKPARQADFARAIADLAGGPGALADAVLRHLDAGQQWLAGHLAEMATPDSEHARHGLAPPLRSP